MNKKGVLTIIAFSIVLSGCAKENVSNSTSSVLNENKLKSEAITELNNREEKQFSSIIKEITNTTMSVEGTSHSLPETIIPTQTASEVQKPITEIVVYEETTSNSIPIIDYEESDSTNSTESTETTFTEESSAVYEASSSSEENSNEYYWSGEILTPQAGTVYGPSGKETYYNLEMSGVISIMRELGYDEYTYPYWIRNDGCKMLGDWIIVAADLSIRPRGTILPTSLGWGIVCDTGGFIYSDPYQLDLAVNWN